MRVEPVRPGTVMQGYRIDRKLGSGGFGHVYLAWQEGRPVALKFVRLRHAGDWAKRELSILLYLRHPHVVRLLGHMEGPEQAPEYLVLVMEYVEGRTLYAWAEQENPSARRLVRVLLKLCVALAAVHSAQVLHRDLKGDNVLVRDSDGEPVLVDFGVSGVPWAPRVTQDVLAPGAPAYRSPECVRYLVDPTCPQDAPYPYTQADDLYAHGVSLYVLLTGEHPFQGRDRLELMGRILREVPRAPHELNPRVPPALSDLCMRLLEKEPQDRVASAEALGEVLEALQAQPDASWDVPLFLRSTKPAPAELPPPPVALPAPDSPVKAPSRPLRRRLPRAGVLLGVLMAGGLLLLVPRQWPGTESASAPALTGRAAFPGPQPTSEASFFREVAPPWRPPEADAGAAPPRAETPAPVVPRTTLREGEKRLKPKKQKKVLDAAELARWCLGLGAAAATNAACVGAGAQQVRFMPEPQACPAGALEAVLEDPDGRYISETGGFFLPGANPFATRNKSIPVKEGPLQVKLLEEFNKLPVFTILSGRLLFGPERVYGRFTQALLPSGETVPVCLTMVTIQDRDPGVPIEGIDEQGNPIVYQVARARVVRSFE